MADSVTSVCTDGGGSLPPAVPGGLRKSPTGIAGLDEVTGGGLPSGRPTLVCGPAGCGKTLLAVQFLVRGITEYGEPGVLVAFEESVEELITNVASLGFDLAQLEADGQLVVDAVRVEPAGMQETGEWDLEALFLRLGCAIDEVGAKRVVLDTIENLFGAFPNAATLRAELRRLFDWLKDRGVTAVITGERGDGRLTRHGIEEYVSDCVIVLDHRVTEQTSTRRLRIVKYRGSVHGTNEYPFLIDASGISVLPITSLGLQHSVSDERHSTGMTGLDAMLGGSGFYRGSSVLVTGTAGTGKSTIGLQFCAAACARGERALYFAFEEPQAQILRNMRSVGIDLVGWVQQGLLRFRCARPGQLGLEAHLVDMQRAITEYDPAVVVMDPISNLLGAGNASQVSAMLTRHVDFLKCRGVTALFTSLASADGRDENHQVTSLADTWLLLRALEANGERTRALYVMKSRGMAHSNQIREFLVTAHGLDLVDVVVGPEGVLTGSARDAWKSRGVAAAAAQRAEHKALRADLERRRASVAGKVDALWRTFEVEAAAVRRLVAHDEDDAAGNVEQLRRRTEVPDQQPGADGIARVGTR